VSTIAMWGAPSSGKTTFLAALSLSLAQQGTGWKLASEEGDEASERALVNMTKAMRNREFPKATGLLHDLRWKLVRQVTETSGGWLRKKELTRAEVLTLDLVDSGGEFVAADNYGKDSQVELVKRLQESRGIVYMFDPIREFELRDTFDHTFGICMQLLGKFTGKPGFDGYLPHHVAVCVTKFDELPVFESARQLGLLTTDPDDPHEFPRVAEEDARLLFGRLCDANGDGTMVRQTLESYFRPDRIRYFVTSAVGFHVNPDTGVFDPDDPQNLLPDPKGNGGNRVRGAVRPINVVEPLLWLSTRVPSASAIPAPAGGTGTQAALPGSLPGDEDDGTRAPAARSSQPGPTRLAQPWERVQP
jgi:hypothetical protein